MSLSGNINYSVPNLQNEYALAEIENEVATNTENIALLQADVSTLQTDVATNTTDIQILNLRADGQDAVIGTLFTRVGEAETDIENLQAEQITQNTNIANNTTVNNTQDTNIASILQRITDISYNSGADTTFINNRLTIRSTIDGVTSATPQLTLWNTTTQAPNQIIYSIMAGVENGNWNNLAREGDCLMLTRNQTGVAGSYTGGMIFTTHGGSSGFRFSYDPAVPSVFRSNIDIEGNQLKTTGDITAGTITLAGVDLTTTLNNLSSSISANSYNLTPITYVSVPGIPGDPPISEVCTIDAQDININGDVLINGHDIITEISTNTANIATNASNIATNADNIATLLAIDHSILTTDLNCDGFDIVNAGVMTSANISTENLKVVSVGAGPETIIETTTNSGDCIMDISAPSGTETSLIISTQNSLAVSKNFVISNDIINTSNRIISNLNTQTGTFLDITDWETVGGAFYKVQPVLGSGPSIVELETNVFSTTFKFITTGTYEIKISWSQVSPQGNNGGLSDFTVYTGADSFGASVPLLNDCHHINMTGQANTEDGFVSDTLNNKMEVDENGNYQFIYRTKEKTGEAFVRPNRWFIDYTANFTAGTRMNFYLNCSTANWSFANGKWLIKQIA